MKITVKLDNSETVMVILSASDSELGYSVVAKTEKGEEIGKFEFRHIEDERHEYLMLCCMFIEGWAGVFKRKGIGRNILIYAKEFYGLPIVVAPNDGIRREDGCHLTGDGPIFVNQMIRERIISQDFSPESDCDEW